MNNYTPAIRVWTQCVCGHPKSAHRKKLVLDANGSRVKERGRFLFHLHCPADVNQTSLFTPRKVTKAIGYDAGEPSRAKIKENDKYVYRYFLIEWGWYLERLYRGVQTTWPPGSGEKRLLLLSIVTKRRGDLVA